MHYMTDESDEDEPKAKRICLDCVRDDYLRELITEENVEADYNYCDKRGLTMSIGNLAKLVDEAFQSHYVRTSTEPSSFDHAMMSDRECQTVSGDGLAGISPQSSSCRRWSAQPAAYLASAFV